MTILTPKTIIGDRYDLLHPLGAGASATTYEAKDLETQKQVAVKVLSWKQLRNWDKTDLFQQEVKSLKKLNNPGIPKYIEHFEIETETDRLFCIVQQLALGKPLSTLVQNGWLPDEDPVKEIAGQILDILIYLQGQNPPVFHRDIKPQNLIYNPTNKQLFLVDFGTVRDKFRHTVTGTLAVGTPGYAAPEQLQGGANLTTDLYGLGTTLLFLLTGKHSDELTDPNNLKINFRPHVKITPKFAKWLDRLIQHDQDNRLPSAKIAQAILKGNLSLKDYPSLKEIRPPYTSIILKKSPEKLTITIPPAFRRRRYEKRLPLAMLAWYGGLFVTLFAVGASTNIFGVILYVILMVLQNYWLTKESMLFWLKFGRIGLLLAALLYSLFDFRLRWGLFLAVILLFADVYYNGEERRKKTLGHLLLKTTIELDANSSYLQIQRFFFGKGNTERQRYDEPKAIIAEFGGLLTKAEKYWLGEEINAWQKPCG